MRSSIGRRTSFDAARSSSLRAASWPCSSVFLAAAAVTGGRVTFEPVPGAETADALRSAYVDFLTARLGTRQWLPGSPR